MKFSVADFLGETHLVEAASVNATTDMLTFHGEQGTIAVFQRWTNYKVLPDDVAPPSPIPAAPAKNKGGRPRKHPAPV